MKPAAFSYCRPSTVGEAVRLLADYSDGDARILAGGQSLGPILAFRLSRPSHLIDINDVRELNCVRIEDEKLVIGAIVRHSMFHKPVEPGPLGHLLTTVVQSIAHFPIRTRGTLCGSLAHSDPASEWCLVAATLDAQMHAQSVRGRRVLNANDYFLSTMTTALESDELLVEARFPLLAASTRFGFCEFSRRKGDFAIAASLACYRVEGARMSRVRVGVGGAEDCPRRINEVGTLLAGKVPSETLFIEAGRVAAASIEPVVDPQVSEDYRRQLVSVMTYRALMQTLDHPQK